MPSYSPINFKAGCLGLKWPSLLFGTNKNPFELARSTNVTCGDPSDAWIGVKLRPNVPVVPMQPRSHAASSIIVLQLC